MKPHSIQKPTNKIKVWDLPTRVFHWALAIGFVVSFASAKMGEMDLHSTSAVYILGLLIFRLIWGFAGSVTARFAHFIPSIFKLKAYLRQKEPFEDHVGHSPLGALAVVVLLLLMLFQLLTGLVADDDIYTAGPLREMVSDSLSDWATSSHSLLSDILLGFVILHIAAVFFYWLVKKQNLIKPMITGTTFTSQKIVGNHYGEYKKVVAVIAITLSIILAYSIFNGF